MEQVKVLDLKKSILEDNDADANLLRQSLQDEKTCYINIMSSPGSGKTTTIKKTIELLGDSLRAGVIEADIDSDVDARAVQEAGIPAVQAHTGGMCHLDADMSRQALRALGTQELDLVILENVGNLVCPAEFDTGAHFNLVILSVPEGDDKPLKYPLVFQTSQAVLINKIDAEPAFDFDRDRVAASIRDRNPAARIFFVSARTGEGMEDFCAWLKARVEEVIG